MRRHFVFAFVVLLSISFVAAQCVDTDHGRDYFNKGSVNINGTISNDVCNGLIVTEYVCGSDGSLESTTYECDEICLEGCAFLYVCLPS